MSQSQAAAAGEENAEDRNVTGRDQSKGMIFLAMLSHKAQIEECFLSVLKLDKVDTKNVLLVCT